MPKISITQTLSLGNNTNSHVNIKNFIAFKKYLIIEGISKFSLKSKTRFDLSDDWYETALSVATVEEKHFNWLVEGVSDETRYL